MELNNYHVDLITIEEDYKDKLIILLGILINNLNKSDLTKVDIQNIINDFYGSYKDEIKENNKELIDNVYRVSNKSYDLLHKNNTKLIKNVTIHEVKKKEYVEITDDFVDNIIKDIELQYNKLLINKKLNDNKLDINNNKIDIINKINKAINNNIEYIAKVVTFKRITHLAKKNGYTQYLWVTQKDTRVRDTHEVMDERWVNIDIAPAITNYNHVGCDYNCRCYIGALA